jgi:hypothetical protein
MKLTHSLKRLLLISLHTFTVATDKAEAAADETSNKL